MTSYITAGACLCLVRGFQFPYITLQIPALFDFGLHDLFAWVWIFESEDRARRKLCITLCRSWLRFRRCLRWMTIGLTTLLAPRGKCVSVCVCVPAFVVATRGSVIMRTTLCSFSVTHALRHTQTKTWMHAPMHTMLQLLQPETDTMSCTVSTYLPIFVLKYRQNNSPGAR